ncbi:MFS transporter [Eggerthella sp. NSJ-70]|uniref:MFS transporter n=1 Tax=Eggerthella hominis TaxID=2763043 RepID=A0ABR7BUY7_9ACTN|nr:MFS transporter [Eggerthella hominis]MBC5585404.1 MFS transporter [Eggerthella hominis]
MHAEKTSSPHPGLTRKTWTLIILLSFFGQVAWALENNFFNLFIQDVFNASLADVALMVSASALTAAATTLFVGAWSDRVGRRKAFIGAGTILWGASIIVFAYLQTISLALAGTAAAAMAFGVTLTIVFDCVMTFFGSLANDSCFNAWVTDITTEKNRGKVEGVNSAMPLLAMLAVFGGAMFLMIVRPDGTVTYDYPLFFTIVGVAVVVLGIVVVLLMQDSRPERTQAGGYLDNVRYGFRPRAVSEHRMLYLVLLAYLVFATALQVFMPYYVLYLRLPYILGENYVFVMAPGIVIAAVFTILYGKRVDRRGFLRAVVVPLALFVAGCLVLTLLTSAAGVFVGSVLMLCGYLGAVACFGAEVRNNTPAGYVGAFQGVRIFMAVLIPMLVGPWIGSTLSATSGAIGFGVVGDGFTPSSLIFLGGAVVALLTFAVLPFIRAQRRRND